jgi:hypothetical protein
MTPKAEIIVEGSYQYFQNNVNYCQEDFKLVHNSETKQYLLYADILSKTEDGETLKIAVQYEMNQHFNPISMQIEKSLLNNYALETFKYDSTGQKLLYTFKTPTMTQDFKKSLNFRHYLSSPAFCASVVWLKSRKITNTSRTSITLVSSTNEWTYEAPPKDKTIYAELKTGKHDDFKLNSLPLPAQQLLLYQHDAVYAVTETPVEVICSKDLPIPFQLIEGDLKITLTKYKTYSKA